jgi:2-polyprenyl-6-methoxyphenol hydroxylase-like FAD-dependent oxidoreductase
MHAIVIGAGIGGLATAGALRSYGHEVTVIERSATIEPIGAGISIFANGFRALDELGAADSLRHPVDASLRTLQRTPGGDVLAEVPREPSQEFGVMHRADLQRALLERTSGARLRLGVGARVQGATGAVAIQSAADPSATDELISGDLVVIADGIRSRNRATVTTELGARYSGYSAWRAVTRHPVDLSDAAGETWGFRERFGFARCPTVASTGSASRACPRARGSATSSPKCGAGSRHGTPRSPRCSTRPTRHRCCDTTSTTSPGPCAPSRGADACSSATPRTR